MKITFLGAAKNVTGSRFLLQTDKSSILIDCGLYQERDLKKRNWDPFPFPPDQIDAVLITHAHIDHSGYLPKLVREGFNGPIYCTGPTADIVKIALLDSARLQEHDAEFKKMRHQREKRKGPHPVIPLYTVADAENVFGLFKPLDYGTKNSITDDINAIFHEAGHIFGAAMIELFIRDKDKENTCVFSGDIGRWDRPILKDPTCFKQADAVFVESTYGNRTHDTQQFSLEKLERIINETHVAGGNIVIPTFAIERAQELLFFLKKLLSQNRIPHLLTFLDSPMAVKVLQVFEKYPQYYDDDAAEFQKEEGDIFNFPLLTPSPAVETSKAINHIKGSSIILAGSGMCTGGRIKHHLINNITRPESTILFVGYQAVGTLGRYILERPENVRIHGQLYPVKARIEKINGFSAHADKNELLRWISCFDHPEKIFVVHGEQTAAESFAEALRTESKADKIIVPEFLDEHTL